MPANTPGPRELFLGANTASAKVAGQRSCAGPPGIPRDAGAGLFSPALNAHFYSRSPSSAAVINPGHLPLRASTNAASLGLANKAITTREKRELIPECWRWALRCHIAPGRSGKAAGLGRLQAGQQGAHSHMEPTSDLLGITAVIFPGRKLVSQAWLLYLQPPERQGSASPGAGKGKKWVQEERQHHRGCLWGWRGGCEPPHLMGLLLWAEGCKTQSQACLRAPLKM